MDKGEKRVAQPHMGSRDKDAKGTKRLGTVCKIRGRTLNSEHIIFKKNNREVRNKEQTPKMTVSGNQL